MNHSSKILLGIITFLPIVLTGLILSAALTLVFQEVSSGTHLQEADPAFLFGNVFYIIGLASIIGLLSVGLMIFYIIHVLNNKAIDKTLQVVWILILIFTSGIGTMVYWYMNIWRDPAPSSKSMV